MLQVVEVDARLEAEDGLEDGAPVSVGQAEALPVGGSSGKGPADWDGHSVWQCISTSNQGVHGR